MYALLASAPTTSPFSSLAQRISTSSFSSSTINSGNFSLRLMLYSTAHAINIGTIVFGELAKPLLRHGNFLFYTPNTLSTIFLVFMWALLYFFLAFVTGLSKGVNK